MENWLYFRPQLLLYQYHFRMETGLIVNRFGTDYSTYFDAFECMVAAHCVNTVSLVALNMSVVLLQGSFGLEWTTIVLTAVSGLLLLCVVRLCALFNCM